MSTNNAQHTIKVEFSLEGVGVHSGENAKITIKPAPVGSGIIFVRTDVTDRRNDVPAKWDNVVDTKMCTVIGNDAGVIVSTVEHIMSAFSVVGLDNAVVEIDGPEMPIMDGSSYPFVQALSKAGLVAQKKNRQAIKILKNVVCSENGTEVSFSPATTRGFSVEIEFDSKAIGYQKFECSTDLESYVDDIAPARTFGFMHEVEYLRSIGLAKGGTLDNAVVIDGDEIVNPEGLRFDDEFARHKLLDAIGDVCLAGMPVIGQYHGFKSSHAMNNILLKALFADPSSYEIVELNQDDSVNVATAACVENIDINAHVIA